MSLLMKALEKAAKDRVDTTGEPGAPVREMSLHFSAGKCCTLPESEVTELKRRLGQWARSPLLKSDVKRSEFARENGDGPRIENEMMPR